MKINLNLLKIEQSIRDFFRIKALPKKNALKNFLRSEYIILADVGATGNPQLFFP
jgi:hypothetical protein